MSRLPLTPERRLFAVFLLLVLMLAALSGWQWRNGAPVSANLLDILPESEQDLQVERARQAMDAALQRELIVLLRHPQAEQLLPQWLQPLEASGLFSRIDYRIDGQLEVLGQQLLDGRVLMVPQEVRRQLADDPTAYLDARVAAFFDPLASFSLVSPQQDWLGLTTVIQQHLQQQARIQAGSQGFLQVSAGGETWQVLRLQAVQDGFAGNSASAVAAVLEGFRQQVEQSGGELLAGGALLFNASAQTRARGEIQWLGSFSLLGALVLIIWFFRRLNSLLAALPALFGLWLGVTACIAVFGQVHAMTLVLGVSLIGVTIDFPMHYMSKAWTRQSWHSMQVLRATLPGLTLGMACNAIGYLALAFTPFPALSQVAVFSVAGLLGAWLCTVCALPLLLDGRRALRPWQQPLRWMQCLLDWHRQLTRRIAGPWWLLTAVVFVGIGFARLQMENDLRQWVSPEPQLLEQARQIGELTGQQPTSQFFLVQGDDERQVLQRLQLLLEQLDSFRRQGLLSGYQSVLDVLAGLQGEPALQDALAGLDEKTLQPLLGLGVDTSEIQREIIQLRQQQVPDVVTALASPLAEPWRMLWLPDDQHGGQALVRLQGLTGTDALAEWAQEQSGIVWVDQPRQLNQLFTQTQQLALWAKLLASLAILVLLVLVIGWQGAVRTLGISLLAALLAAASLGWLGLPVTLFSVFGFLLVTAIGVDYAIMMYEGVGGAATSLLGAALAAATTWLSFGLLMLSATPAVSSFGLAVSLGLAFCFLLAPWAARSHR